MRFWPDASKCLIWLKKKEEAPLGGADGEGNDSCVVCRVCRGRAVTPCGVGFSGQYRQPDLSQAWASQRLANATQSVAPSGISWSLKS
jgi:hypothetical protein